MLDALTPDCLTLALGLGLDSALEHMCSEPTILQER